MSDVLCIMFLVVGVLFNLFGCVGLIRLPDVYNRLQSATKCVTLGTCSIMLSVVCYYGWSGVALKALLAIPLIFFSATVAAHALARGSYLFGIKLGEETVIDEYKEIVHPEEKGGRHDALPKTKRTKRGADVAV